MLRAIVRQQHTWKISTDVMLAADRYNLGEGQ